MKIKGDWEMSNPSEKRKTYYLSDGRFLTYYYACDSHGSSCTNWSLYDKDRNFIKMFYSERNNTKEEQQELSELLKLEVKE